MCFHTAQIKTVNKLEKRYQVKLTTPEVREKFDTPRYHINGFAHPSLLVIPQEAPTVIAPGLWGIIPKTKKSSQINAYYKDAMRFGGGLNAQSEKLYDHFIYKQSSLTNRCLIPVTGFFEPHEYRSKKYPIHIKRQDNDVLSLAGLYTLIDGIITFTILTKTASPLFAKIHNKKKRQPLLLPQDLEGAWLNPELNKKDLKALIEVNYPENELQTFTVSRDLFSPKVNSDTPHILNQVSYDGVAI